MKFQVQISSLYPQVHAKLAMLEELHARGAISVLMKNQRVNELLESLQPDETDNVPPFVVNESGKSKTYTLSISDRSETLKLQFKEAETFWTDPVVLNRQVYAMLCTLAECDIFYFFT